MKTSNKLLLGALFVILLSLLAVIVTSRTSVDRLMEYSASVTVQEDNLFTAEYLLQYT